MLVYCAEVKYYRQVLRISYEFGTDLRRRGILVPDAVMNDGRPLFSMAEADILRHEQAVRLARGKPKGELVYV